MSLGANAMPCIWPRGLPAMVSASGLRARPRHDRRQPPNGHRVALVSDRNLSGRRDQTAGRECRAHAPPWRRSAIAPACSKVAEQHGDQLRWCRTGYRRLSQNAAVVGSTAPSASRNCTYPLVSRFREKRLWETRHATPTITVDWSCCGPVCSYAAASRSCRRDARSYLFGNPYRQHRCLQWPCLRLRRHRPSSHGYFPMVER